MHIGQTLNYKTTVTVCKTYVRLCQQVHVALLQVTAWQTPRPALLMSSHQPCGPALCFFCELLSGFLVRFG